MNTKHTPHTQGPWTYDQEDNLILDARGRLIGQPRGLGVGLEQRKANGKLMSAAPELLEALQAVYEMCDGYVPNTSKEVWRKAQAAIFKAIGASHVSQQ